MAALGAPRDLIVRSTGSKRLGVGVALFCGPLPGAGSVLAGPDIAIELEDPVLGRKLVHGYEVKLPPVAP